MKYVAWCSMVMAMGCHTALSAESTDADSQRRLKELTEKLEREPARSRESINAYAASVIHTIERHVVYPTGSGGKRCIASVTQDKSGRVMQLELSECEAGALAYAVRAAVRAASPLPLPSDMRYFVKNLRLVFVVPDGR